MRKIILQVIVCFALHSIIAQTVTIQQFSDPDTPFTAPVDIQNAGDDRLFVVEKAGVIKILNADGTVNNTPFLDIQNIVFTPQGLGDERGLLGLAFHPDFSNNGFFYLNYIDNNQNTQISRFSVNSEDPNSADAAETEIISYNQPFTNHNGGGMAFGPDGYLYIASGDGGSGNDPGNRAQNTNLLLGKLLRIDVDDTTNGGGTNYGIPTDNPFADGVDGAPEVWAYGLRNPFRFSFDFTTNEVWIGDVGQTSFEEIDRASSITPGLNYGWRCYEGNTLNPNVDTSSCPDIENTTQPVLALTRNQASSIVGGYVYRGNRYSDLQGVYIFTDSGTGLIGTIDQDNNFINQGSSNQFLVTFGEDSNGELYTADISSGNIFIVQGGILITDEFSENSVSIFPNPASNQLNINAGNTTLDTIEVFDLKGSLLVAQHLDTTQVTIDISTLSHGLYLVRIAAKNSVVITKKLVIE